jgi:hypothetical protein
MFVTLKWEEDEINLTVRKISKKKKKKKEKINLVIMRSLQVNHAIRKHQVFPTLSSRKIQLISGIRKDRCQPCN